jgi:hypothetical protein
MLVRFVYWVFIIKIRGGLHQDHTKTHGSLVESHRQRGDSKMTKLHYKAAAMAGDKVARYNIGRLEAESGNVDLRHLLGIIVPCIICYFSFIKVLL